MGGLWSCQTSVSTAYSRSSGNESGLLPTQGKGAHSGRNRIMCLWASLHFFSWGFWAQARHLVDAVQPTGYSAIQRFRGICRPSYTEFMAFFTPAEDQSTSAPIHAPWVGAAGIQQVSAAVLSSLQSLSLGHQSQWLVLLCLSFHLSQWSPLHLVLSLCLHRRPLLSQGFLWPPHQSPEFFTSAEGPEESHHWPRSWPKNLFCLWDHDRPLSNFIPAESLSSFKFWTLVFQIFFCSSLSLGLMLVILFLRQVCVSWVTVSVFVWFPVLFS